MPRVKYIIQGADKTQCSTCSNKVDLIAVQDLLKSGPMFYICWVCRTVAQVGVGPLERENADDQFVQR